MTTIRHNYLPDLQEQISYNDEITFWIDKDTGDMHIRTELGENVLPHLIGIGILDMLRQKQEIYKESVKKGWFSF